MATASFLEKVGKNASRAYWYIAIEGIRRRYGSKIPDWASALTDTGTDRVIRPWFKIPPQLTGQRADPLDGETEPSSATIQIGDRNNELTELFSIHNDSGGRTLLAADIDDDDTEITVDDASEFSFPCDLFLDRETVRAASALGNTITVTRGMYGSTAIEHKVTDAHGNDRKCWVTDRPTFLYTREVILYEGREGLDEADSIVLMRGYLDDAEEAEGVWTLNLAGFLRRLSCMIGEDAVVGYLRFALWGGDFKDNGDPTFHGQRVETAWYTWLMSIDQEAYDLLPAAGTVLIDNEIIRYAEKEESADYNYLKTDAEDIHDSDKITYKGRGILSQEIGLKTSTIADIVEEAVGAAVGGVEPLGKRPYFMEAHFPGAEVKHVLSWHDFSAGTDPISVFLQLLTSTGDGTNGTYDTLPKAWAAGVDEDLVDVAGLEALRDEWFEGMELRFVIAESTDLKDWTAENLLRPCLLFPAETDEGKITLKKIYERSDCEEMTGLVTLDESLIRSGSVQFSPGKSPIADVIINMNHYPPENEFYGKVNVIFANTTEQYQGTVRNIEIDCGTVYDNRIGKTGRVWHGDLSGFPLLLGTLIDALSDRFAFKPCPTLSLEIPYGHFVKARLGDVVRVTCQIVPNLMDSDRGIVLEYFQVIEEDPKIDRGGVGLRLWQIGVHDTDHRRLAPSAKVSSYEAEGANGDPRINLYDDEFSASGFDVDAFSVGDKIKLITEEYAPIAPEVVPDECEIKAIGSGVGTCWVDLVAAPSTAPGDGHYIETTDYNTASATQKAQWAFQADDGETLGAGEDPAHVRKS